MYSVQYSSELIYNMLCLIFIIILLLTHKVFIIIIICIVDDAETITLIVATQAAGTETIAVNSWTTLEASLPQTLV